MIRISWIRLLVNRCLTEQTIPHLNLSNNPNINHIRKTYKSEWMKDWIEEEDSGKIFDTFKDRITQKIGDRLDKSKQNGFKLFNIEQDFEIDQFRLQREMRKLQKILHPDKFISKSVKTQLVSAQLSAMVNDFYRILSNPYERGKYLLSLMTNTSLDELEEKLGRIQLEGEFLARMMDISEQAQCPSSDTFTLRKLNAELDGNLASLTKELKEDFAAKRYDNIYKNLGRLKFVANCHQNIVDRLGSLDNF